MKVGVDTAQQVGTNQFSHWNTDELKQWVEDYMSCPLLHTINNINTYYEAEKELNRREECLIEN